jgi:hypothetical protein
MQHSCMRLLPQIFGVEAQVRIRMKDLGDREPAFNAWSEPRPGQRVFLTPTPERTEPTLAHLLSKTVETGEVPGHSVAVEVALHCASQPLAEFRHWLVPASSKLLLQLFELCEDVSGLPAPRCFRLAAAKRKLHVRTEKPR